MAGEKREAPAIKVTTIAELLHVIAELDAEPGWKVQVAELGDTVRGIWLGAPLMVVHRGRGTVTLLLDDMGRRCVAYREGANDADSYESNTVTDYVQLPR